MANSLDENVTAYAKDKIYYFDEKIILSHYAKKIISKFDSSLSVLDLGLGHGITAEFFSKHFSDYTILDGSEEIIKQYKDSHPDLNAKIELTYFEDYKTDKKFDLIIMGFILEHVDNPELILNIYKNYLSENGKIVIAVPNAEAMNRRLGHYAGLLDDMFKLSEYDKELGHKRYFSVDTVKKMIKDTSLKLLSIEGIYLKPLTTRQMISLNLSDEILRAFCTLGEIYPELSLGIMAEITR